MKTVHRIELRRITKIRMDKATRINWKNDIEGGEENIIKLEDRQEQ